MIFLCCSSVIELVDSAIIDKKIFIVTFFWSWQGSWRRFPKNKKSKKNRKIFKYNRINHQNSYFEVSKFQEQLFLSKKSSLSQARSSNKSCHCFKFNFLSISISVDFGSISSLLLLSLPSALCVFSSLISIFCSFSSRTFAGCGYISL